MIGAIIGDIVGSPYEFDRGSLSVKNHALYATVKGYSRYAMFCNLDRIYMHDKG